MVDIAKQIGEHEARNRELVKRIIELGGDLDQVRMIEVFFISQGEKNAYKLANELKKKRLLNIDINKVENKPELWNVHGELQATVNEVIDRRHIKDLVVLASGLSSEYDGWGTNV